ncbi:hypothetical protein AB0N17_45070 [Streptomyces sp. NPDC051133]|uniref:hypothetical protein n=1 Tax=Streptomyces sp. NPDC051133 TaxID=3155521 RepID=UPI003416CFBA
MATAIATALIGAGFTTNASAVTPTDNAIWKLVKPHCEAAGYTQTMMFPQYECYYHKATINLPGSVCYYLVQVPASVSPVWRGTYFVPGGYFGDNCYAGGE